MQPTLYLGSEGTIYNITREDYAVVENLTSDKFEKIKLIAYYGYGYESHIDTRWLAITQMLIWKTIRPDMDIYFSWSSYGNNRDDSLYLEEISELQNLVNIHYQKPSFDSKSYRTPGRFMELNDNNNILNKYQIINGNSNARIENNKLIISNPTLGIINVTLEKKSNRFGNVPLIYYSTESQDILKPGDISNVTSSVQIDFAGGKVAIHKKDYDTNLDIPQGNASLKNAKYNIYDLQNNLISSITTDEYGYGLSDELMFGQYYLKEISPSTGYLIDDTKYNFSINSTGKKDINVLEKVIKSKIQINLQDSDTNICNSELENTKYVIYNNKDEIISNLVINNECKAISDLLPYGTYKIKEEVSAPSYKNDNNIYEVIINDEETKSLDISKEVIKGSILINTYDLDNNNNFPQGNAEIGNGIFKIYKGTKLVETLVANLDGYVKSAPLSYGKYTVKQIKPSKGYEKDSNSYVINIVNDNEEIPIIFRQKVIENEISILKQIKNLKDSFLLPESNIRFEIYDSSNNFIKEIITDENGYAKTILPYDNYTIKQINTSDGTIKINDFDIQVNEITNKIQYFNLLDEQFALYLKVNNIDNETHNLINDTSIYKILDKQTNKYVTEFKSGQYVEIFKTNNGYFFTNEMLSIGSYTLIQLESPNGYFNNINGIDFDISDKIQYDKVNNINYLNLNFENKPLKGIISIHKTNENDIPIDNVEFEIYKDNKLIQKLITDKNGNAKSSLLSLGDYQIKEVKTNDNYVKDENIYTITLNDDNNKKEIITNSINIINRLATGNIIFTAKNKNIGIQDIKINVYDENGNLIYTDITDKNGQIFINDLIYGKYTLREIKNNNKYDIYPQNIDVTINQNNKLVKINLDKENIYLPDTKVIDFKNIYNLLAIIFGSIYFVQKKII